MENKLISMVDFVLEQDKLILKLSPSRSGSTQYNEFTALKLDRITNYANFLKQPLTLNMFVPCDEDGNILTAIIEPNKKPVELYGFSHKELIEIENIHSYQQAKERVLFEGVEIKFDETDNPKHPMAFIIRCRFSVICSGYKDVRFFKHVTIEDLIKLDLTLTESALKQIGIK